MAVRLAVPRWGVALKEGLNVGCASPDDQALDTGCGPEVKTSDRSGRKKRAPKDASETERFPKDSLSFFLSRRVILETLTDVPEKVSPK